MATTIAKHAVQLTANTRGYTVGMKAAARTASSFGGAIRSAARMMTGWTASIAAVAGVGSIGMLVKSSSDSIDKISKWSDVIGFSTQKLSGLKHAAELAGADIETTNKALRHFSRNLGNLRAGASGSEEVAQGLEMIGLAVEDIRNMSPYDVFLRVSDAISAMDDPMLRTAAIMRLFGRGGAAIANMLLTGADGISATVAEAERLGLAFDRIDGSKVEEANDSLTRVKAAVTGAANQITIALAPLITEVSTQFVDWATSADLSSTRIVGAMDSIAAAADKVVNALSRLKGWKEDAEIGAEMVMGYGARAAARMMSYNARAAAHMKRLLGRKEESPIPPAWERNPEQAEKIKALRNNRSADAAKAITDGAENRYAQLENQRAAEKTAKGDTPISDWFGGVKKTATVKAEGTTETARARLDMPIEDEIEEDDGLAKEAERVIAKTKTPFETFTGEIGKLDEMLSRGLISEEVYLRAAGSALNDLTAGSDKLNESLQERLDLQKEINGESAEGQFLAPSQDMVITPTPVMPTPVFSGNAFPNGQAQGDDAQLNTLRQILAKLDYMARTPRTAMAG